MSSAETSITPQAGLFAAVQSQQAPKVSQLSVLAAYGPTSTKYANATQFALLTAYAPPATKYANSSQDAVFVSESGGATNVTAYTSQAAIFIAYKEGIPGESRQAAWTFILDGHRFYVLPLGAEGDWAYDTTTQQWCQLQTQGFDGLNFTHGVMWDIRIVGGDALYGVLYEMDPNEPEDEQWRPIEHIVTGGVATRNVNFVPVGNFRLTATSGDLQENDVEINLRWSDDNGNTWSAYHPLTLQAGNYSQLLIWSSLGSFRSPGRMFEISDQAGLVGIYGADAHLLNYDDEDQQTQ